jgi:hypothetical protein
MQPYLLPHRPYFDLMKKVDAFVVLDDVQFVRRSWISRNQLLDSLGNPKWFNVPVMRSPRESSIRSIVVADTSWGASALRRFPAAQCAATFGDHWLRFFELKATSLVEVLDAGLRCVRTDLVIDTPMISSSSLEYDRSGSGEEKILSICNLLGAQRYVNPPGGRSLYSYENFRKRGVALDFEAPQPMQWSVLEQLYGGDGTFGRSSVSQTAVFRNT